MRLLTLKTVLVATDLEETSTPALRTGARLATLAGARLHLVYVSDIRRGMLTTLRDHYRDVVGDGAELDRVDVIAGSPGPAIVQHALDTGADVVILGPHRGAARRELGSTAAAVVGRSRSPCLVAARELNLPLQSVIAPIDVSPVARGTLSVALSWASALRPRHGAAQLTVLHMSDGAPSADVTAAVSEEVRRARARAAGAARVEVREQIVQGSDPVAGILRAADGECADLLVMGTRGEASAPFALGSVSAAVARTTPCPLLLVPPTVWMEQSE